MTPAVRDVVLLGRKTSVEVRQFFDRLITIPTPTRQQAYVNFIDAQVAAGIWAKRDAILLLAAEDVGTSFVNLKSSSFTPTIVNTSGDPIFAVDQGWSGNDIGNALLANFNPATAGGNLTQNGANFSAWSLTATQQNKYLWFTNTSNLIGLQPYNLSGNVLARLNSFSPQSTTNADATASGFFATNRTASNAWTVKRNDVLNASYTDASVALENGAVFICPAPIICAGYAFGGWLSAAEQTADYNIWRAHMTALGAP